jgi:D-alanyl-lipoteichoic acid acyltransferase DltB (MBOAT superfamily)
MLFNSFEYLAFLAAVLAGYHLLGALRTHRPQNVWLLAASVLFYLSFEAAMLGLLALATATGWLAALGIERAGSPRGKRAWLLLGLLLPLGVLALFKYLDFFAGSVAALLQVFGLRATFGATHLVFPLAISFYTFQIVGYVVDVHRGRVRAVRDPLDFALFVAFFPQLLAGPIERAANLLPQLLAPRAPTVERFQSGCFLIFFGLWKKVVVADGLAPAVDRLYSLPEPGGLDAWLAAITFSVQIYADFAGYTDVARGSARLLGIELIENFRTPYFARNVQEFWNRWHISLSSWIKDYLYFPLALTPRIARRLGAGGLALVTMLIMGLWHGPDWRFALWGLYHGVLIAIYLRLRPRLARLAPAPDARGHRAFALASVLATYALCCLGGILFRSESIGRAGELYAALATDPFGAAGSGVGAGWVGLVLLMLLVDLHEAVSGRSESIRDRPLPVRLAVYAAMVYLLLVRLLAEGGYESLQYEYFKF